MGFESINWLGVFLGWLVAFVCAFIWFGPKTFYPMWMDSMGKKPGEGHEQSKGMAAVFGITIISGIIQAIVLSLVFVYLSKINGAVSLGQGVTAGLVFGFGAVAPSIGHYLFAGRTLKTWTIEYANDILNWLLMGIVLSFFY